jgi:hypothetical protein
VPPFDRAQEPFRRFRQPLRDLEARDRRPNPCPTTRNRPRIITAAAQHEHPRRQRAEPANSPPERSIGERELAHGIVGEPVGACLDHHHLRRKRLTQRHHHFVDQKAELAVVESRRDRQVAPARSLVREAAGIGPPIALVYRDRQHPRFIPKRIFDAVAMMRVEVDIEHTR